MWTVQDKDARRRLSWVLGIIFVIAMAMGAGPGVYLVNPDPSAPGPTPTILGMPILYAWGVGWFFVQAAVVIVAYLTLWRDEEIEA